MKRVFLVLGLISIFLTPFAQEIKEITIFHTNDLHSRLNGFSPESEYSPSVTGNDLTRGGFARIATILGNEKLRTSGTVLTVDAGDFLMGTLFQGIEPETGFQLRLMKQMGYDAVCLGNHEFDFGPGILAEIIKSAAQRGPIPGVLLSNAVLSENDTADNELEKLFNSNTINRTLILNKEGLKIGIFSLLGVVAADNAAYSKPVNFSKQIPEAKKLVKELEREGCDIVICLSHSGVSKDKSGNWAGEDINLAHKVKGIDVIISGHTHTRLVKPIMVNGVPIVQTGEYGLNVGKLTLTYSAGRIAVVDYSLIPVNDSIKGDPSTIALIEGQKQAVTSNLLIPLGLDYDKPVAESSFVLECIEQGNIEDSNLGPLVADAIHSYVNRHVQGGTDVSMVAVGVIRDMIVPGMLTTPDIFRIMSMGKGNDKIPGYPLSRLYVTGRELKNILEVLLLFGHSTPSNYCYYGGLKAEYDPGKGFLRKISKIGIVQSDGKVKDIDISSENDTLYSVVANSYMLEYIGIIRKKSFGLIKVVPKDSGGVPITDMKTAVMDFNKAVAGIQEGKEWLALAEYLSMMNDTNGNGVPDIDQKYRSAIKALTAVNSR